MIRIPNSLGAAANRIQVQKPTPTTDDGLWVKEVSYIDGVKAIARGNKIREVQGLIEEFKRLGNISTNVDDWRKMRGTGIVTDGDEEYKVELHWYEAANVGKVKWKVKRLLQVKMMRVKYIGKSDRFGCINGNIYEVVAEEKNFYRVVDELGEDYLYLKKNFTVAESKPQEEPRAMYA